MSNIIDDLVGDLKILSGFPYSTAVAAARDAVDTAEMHIDAGIIVSLVGGGPMHPAFTDDAIRMKNLGILVLPIYGCVVSGFVETYEQVYNLLTFNQKVTWLHGQPIKEDVIACVRVPIPIPGLYHTLLTHYNIKLQKDKDVK